MSLSYKVLCSLVITGDCQVGSKAINRVVSSLAYLHYYMYVHIYICTYV